MEFREFGPAARQEFRLFPLLLKEEFVTILHGVLTESFNTAW
jgi:hypothetical protein